MATTQQKFDCETCREIWRMLTDPAFEGPIVFGSVQDVASVSCDVAGSLVQAFTKHLKGQFIFDEEAIFKLRRSSRGPCLELVGLKKKSGRSAYWRLLLVAKDTIESQPGIGRILDAEWTDVEVIANWKDNCLSNHGPACENSMKIEHTQPDVLIDVTLNCLVRGCDVQGRYVALSYVWGKHRSKLPEAVTRAELFNHNALSRPDIQKAIFPIIGHAIKLTSQLRERYLWVDALCVDQDDKEHTGRQLKAMAAIYANAVVTIINTDGDAGTGIPGIKGVSSAREQHQRVFQFGDEQLCVRNTGIFCLAGNGKQVYFERGWTYQEHMLSSRRIMFLNNEAHWECQCAVWHEELIPNAEVDVYLNPRLRTIMAGFPDVSALSHAIGEYNCKTLTYAEDALPAISGLLTSMSRSFTGGFLFGLPEMFFAQSLGWQPGSARGLTRRVASELPREEKLRPCDLPSWSWIGWQGRVSIPDDAARINPGLGTIQESFPIADWYCGQSPTAPPASRRLIKSAWYEQRQKWKDATNPLPPGWSRHDISGAPISKDGCPLFPDGCGEFVYRHTSMRDPDTEINDWYFPFPVPDIQSFTRPVMPEQWPYLFCKTEKVHAWAFQGIDKIRNMVPFCDAAGSHSGHLSLHNRESFEQFPDAPPERKIELVALHKVDVYSNTFDEEKQKYGGPIVKEKGMMCVLWVEWENGVAFRRAAGYVYAGLWPMLNPKEIDLVLG
ncbi:hypothetical protein NLG97_g7711 [Lecanicillium saksenae]|uniref:Uncharacterized protein n=1 Tax=Lecanicillium saksenae TaxID=468837 RepID=A0ACC1QML2_9HYPO|nr:hypothetical protein NLG97_g7711 [Lecanicillium saksenae]